jgi:opacity protein-like surface antigen
MKKVSLLGFILAATAPCLASANVAVEAPAQAVAVQAGGPCCPKAFQGFGLKGILGYAVGVDKTKGFVSHRAPGATVFTRDIAARATKGHTGVQGGIGVDYTHRLCNWAVAIGFDATWSGANGNSRFHNFNANGPFPANTTFHQKSHLRNSLQLYGKLGYVMREIAMPFVALGWDNSGYKFGPRHRNAAVVGGFNRHSHKSKRFNAFLWKVGVDFLATKHVVVGFEYTGTIAGRKKAHRVFTDPATGNVFRVAGSLKPQNNLFALTAKILY